MSPLHGIANGGEAQLKVDSRLKNSALDPSGKYAVIYLAGAYHSANETLVGLASLRPGLAVIDGSACGLPLGALIRHLKALLPCLKTLVLMDLTGDRKAAVWTVLQAGADAVLAKPPDAAECLKAARTVLAGGHTVSPKLLSELSNGVFIDRALHGKQLLQFRQPHKPIPKHPIELS